MTCNSPDPELVSVRVTVDELDWLYRHLNKYVADKEERDRLQWLIEGVLMQWEGCNAPHVPGSTKVIGSQFGAVRMLVDRFGPPIYGPLGWFGQWAIYLYPLDSMCDSQRLLLSDLRDEWSEEKVGTFRKICDVLRLMVDGMKLQFRHNYKQWLAHS